MFIARLLPQSLSLVRATDLASVAGKDWHPAIHTVILFNAPQPKIAVSDLARPEGDDYGCLYIYIIVAIGELLERYGRDALDITGPRAVSISILDIPRVDRSRTFSPTTQSALKRPHGVSQTAKMGLAVDSSRLLAASLVLKLRCH